MVQIFSRTPFICNKINTLIIFGQLFRKLFNVKLYFEGGILPFTTATVNLLLATKPPQPLYSIPQIHGLIFRQRLSPCGNKLAVAMDDAVVSVLKISDGSLETLMSETQHGDFVRGLAWKDTNTLWSAGWDHAVIQYTL